MAWIPSGLKIVSEQVARDKPYKTTVRDLLLWFGSYRRGWRTVATIRAALKALNLETVPDFEGPHIDASITIRIVPPSPAIHGENAPPTTTTTQPPASTEPLISSHSNAAERIEPAHQISR